VPIDVNGAPKISLRSLEKHSRACFHATVNKRAWAWEAARRNGPRRRHRRSEAKLSPKTRSDLGNAPHRTAFVGGEQDRPGARTVGAASWLQGVRGRHRRDFPARQDGRNASCFSRRRPVVALPTVAGGRDLSRLALDDPRRPALLGIRRTAADSRANGTTKTFLRPSLPGRYVSRPRPFRRGTFRAGTAIACRS